MGRFVACYNTELGRLRSSGQLSSADEEQLDALLESDPSKIKWTSGLKRLLLAGKELVLEQKACVPSLYRPFSKEWLYFAPEVIHRPARVAEMFSGERPNRAIGLSASESRAAFSVLMTDSIPSLHAADAVGSQYFPLHVVRVPSEPEQALLFSDAASPIPVEAISEFGLQHFRSAYPATGLSKDDVFYYVYGILHSTDYRERYADNLGKELPRIPRVKTVADFWAFSKAGRELGELHVGYEKVPEHPATVEISVKKPSAETYRVESMRFGKGEKVDGKTPKDKTTVVYNEFITVKNIPLEAYDYVVNGKSAIEWVMERQGVSTDKASGIVKDANDYAIETMNDPRYPLSLLLRVITVSLETVRIVKSLPALDIRDDG